MATNFERIKNVDMRSKLIVNGYIHRAQKLMLNFTIPDVIIYACLNYYYLPIEWDSLQSNVVSPKENNWVTFVINQQITDKMCNIFEFEVSGTRIAATGSNHFFIGFIRNSLDTLSKECEIASYGNEEISESLKIQRDEVLLNGHSNQIMTLSRYFNIGDKIKMIFNFDANCCKFYWNDRYLTSRELNTNIVIPALSPFWMGSEFEITNYSFQ